MEFVFRRDVLRPHELPEGVRQSRRKNRRIDVDFDPYRVLITPRYGAFDVRDVPCVLARQVAQALYARGWDGFYQRCPARPVM